MGELVLGGCRTHAKAKGRTIAWGRAVTATSSVAATPTMTPSAARPSTTFWRASTGRREHQRVRDPAPEEPCRQSQIEARASEGWLELEVLS